MCQLIILGFLAIAPANGEAGADAGSTFQDLQIRHDRAFFEDLVRYVAEQGDGPDREEAHEALFDLAIRYSWFAEADPIAKAYLAAPPLGEAMPLAQLVSVMADAESGQLRAAIVLYRNLLGGLDPNEHAPLAANLADTLADNALAAGDAEAAREIYSCLLDRYASIEGIVEKVDAEFGRIKLLGQPAPKIEANDVHGEPLSLGPEPGGRYRLVVFWATWSEPCRFELPALAEARTMYKDRGLDIIGVALDSTRDEIAAIADREGFDWRQVHNATSGADWTEPFRVSSVPNSYLIDPDGQIVRMGLRGPTLGRVLDDLLSDPAAD